MKIRYINEGGLFKTPEQVKKEIEKEQGMSDEEIVSSGSKKMFEGAVCKVLDYLMNDLRREPDYVEPITDYRPVLEHLIFGRYAAYLFYMSYPNMPALPWDYVTEFKSKIVNVDNAKKTIDVDVYVNIINNDWLYYINDIEYRKNAYDDYCGQSNLDAYTDAEKKVGRFRTIRNNFRENIMTELMDLRSGIISDNLKFLIQQYDIRLNKIHLFGEVDGDMTFVLHGSSFTEIAWGTSNHAFDDETIRVIEKMVDSLTDVFVFENKGDVIFREVWHADRQVRVNKNGVN